MPVALIIGSITVNIQKDHHFQAVIRDAGLAQPSINQYGGVGAFSAARHFSWQYSQLKMVCHEVREIAPNPDDEHFLDGVEFVLEFLS